VNLTLDIDGIYIQCGREISNADFDVYAGKSKKPKNAEVDIFVAICD